MKVATSVAIIGGIVAGAVSASAALNLPTMSCSYSFNTNMKLGSRGQSVMDLQKVLNMYPQTQIAESGAGSPGMETTYFGAATKRAANKFQALHLAELGITAPTGNVFAGTRGLLNEVCSGTVSTNTGNTGNTTTTTGPVSAMLSASQPSGAVVAGQAAAKLADLTFTGNGTVTAVELQRTGVSSDTTLNNVYLYDGNTRISDAASVINGGYIRFNSPSGLFTVNGSRTISVRADILSTASAGQTVGVKLNSITAGGAMSTFSNVMGNSLTVAVVSNLSTVDVTAYTPVTTRTVDAGITNLSVFSRTVSIGNHSAMLRAATFRFIGSAPVDSVANLSLYVDSVKVAGPAMVNSANDNKVTFDLGNTPYMLQTGSHTVELRGDVTKGSSRTITFAIENAGDLLIEDSQLSGVNVTPSVGGVGNSFQRLTYDTFNVNSGNVITNQDPAYVVTTLTGGASNSTISQFALKAYGEDVKVSSLSVTPSISGAAISGSSTPAVQGLSNVALYVNGGQVGTSQNWTTGAVTFTLGSSLIIPAGQTVIVSVRADLRNTNSVSYTAGTVSAQLNAGSSNGQGQSSYTIVNVPVSNVTGQSMTVSSGAATFARTSGFTAQTVAPNTTNVKLGSFTLQTGNAEGVVINGATVAVTTTGSFNNISNLVVKSGNVALASPVGQVTSSNAVNFNNENVAINSTKTFDVYADIGSATTSSTYQIDVTLNYRGATSNTTNTVTALGTGAVATVNTATLADATLVSSSPVAQFVVGGTTYGIATYKLATAAAGTQAVVTEMHFTTNGADAIESITVGGITSNVIAGGTTTITGLNIAVGYTGTSVPVTVKFSGFQGSTNGGNLQTGVSNVQVALGYIKASVGSGSPVTNTTVASSSLMTLVASKPTVTVTSSGDEVLNLGALSKLGQFTVTADANGNIAVASTSVTFSTVGVTGAELATSTLVLKDGGTTVSNVSLVVNAGATASTTPVFTFTTPYEISAGQSKTFSIYGTISGSAQSGIVPRVNSTLNASGFKWVDVIGGNVTYTGSTIYNFPTNSYTSKTQ
jgi:hypothetical protein